MIFHDGIWNGKEGGDSSLISHRIRWCMIPLNLEESTGVFSS